MTEYEEFEARIRRDNLSPGVGTVLPARVSVLVDELVPADFVEPVPQRNERTRQVFGRLERSLDQDGCPPLDARTKMIQASLYPTDCGIFAQKKDNPS